MDAESAVAATPCLPVRSLASARRAWTPGGTAPGTSSEARPVLFDTDSRSRRLGAHAYTLLALEVLALGLECRRHGQLRAVELGDVPVAAGGHRGAQRAHEVERPIVLAGRPLDDLLEGAVRRGRHARAAREG